MSNDSALGRPNLTFGAASIRHTFPAVSDRVRQLSEKDADLEDDAEIDVDDLNDENCGDDSLNGGDNLDDSHFGSASDDDGKFMPVHFFFACQYASVSPKLRPAKHIRSLMRFDLISRNFCHRA